MNNKEFIDKDGRVITDKECLKCHQVKFFDEFNTSKSGKYGRHNYCMLCLRAENKKNYDKSRESRIENVIRWNRRNKNKTKIYMERYLDRERPNRKKRIKNVGIPDILDIPELPNIDF